MGSGAEPSPQAANLLKPFRKSKKTFNFLKIFINIERIFDFQKPTEIKNNVLLMGYWKSLVILKEIKNTRGKYLRIWLKVNYDLKLPRKIMNFHTKISIENWFWPGFYPLFPDICHFMQLWKMYVTQFFNNKFFGFGGDSPLPPSRATGCKFLFYLYSYFFLLIS